MKTKIKKENKMNKIILSIVLITTMAVSNDKGKKVFMKKLKAPCSMNGLTFAHMNNQDKWEEFYNNGTLSKEVKRICPKSNLKVKYEEDLFNFVYEFAKDSGKIPSC